MDYELLFDEIRTASRRLNAVSDDTIREILITLADRLVEKSEAILDANRKDLAAMPSANPMYDRLLLDKGRIAAIAEDVRNVSGLPSPSGRLLSRRELPNGMVLSKITVPFGVIGIIYEARPNVTCDVFALCLKSRNACILKGGSDAEHSNRAIASVIREVLEEKGIDPKTATLLPSLREATAALLNAVMQVDLIIPRGSSNLIRYVRENARVPVIETGAGICHAYFDEYGDATVGNRVVVNAKTRRVSVCNALDCLIIHRSRLDDLPTLCNGLQDKQVVIYADEPAFGVLENKYPAELLERAGADSYGTEFLSYRMSIKTVDSAEAAIDHIARYSSRHSESIVSENADRIALFKRDVDAACVYINTPTSFTDGAQFGLGAEIGISTQKMHARGPMALEELNTYKWIAEGHGQIRP